jgi:hypothetical protein
MRWLLNFSAEDLASAAGRSLRSHGRKVLALRQEGASGVVLSDTTSAMLLEVEGAELGLEPWHYTKRVLAELQKELRRAIDALRQGRAWMVPAMPTKRGLVPAAADVEEWAAGRADDTSRYLVRRYQGSFEATFYAAVEDVLVERWEQVRECAAPTCKRLFLRADPRQRYCSSACSQKTCWENFAPTRTRDYKAEYAARIVKSHGPNVKPRHRTR